MPYYRDYTLPWSVSNEDEKRFRKILLNTLGVLFFLGVIWPFLPVPEKDPNEIEEIPPRLAELILEKEPEPEPAPVPEPEPEPEPDAEPEQVVETPPEPVVEPEPVEVPPEPDAREQASVAGLLPFAEDLQALRDNDIVAEVAGQRDLSGAVGADDANERSLITSNVAGGSRGINTAQMSRNTGGSGLGGRSTTRVASPVAGVGGGGGKARRTGVSGKGSRSQEEIELVFDKNKGAIFRLYNRALREDPTLQGKLVLRLTISPAGAVTMCEVVSSELNNPDLERKLVQRVKLFKFAAKDVEAITTTKPIDFFPA
ncbi:MAG: AgmX/PglI C-terminal domain-containing protein [Pseudomonadota bacterium]